MMTTTIKSWLMAIWLLFATSSAFASDEILKPFVLASKGPGTVAEKTEAVSAALLANGFLIIGSYSPYPDATILIVTSIELRNNAAASERGGFGAAQRVSITRVNDEVQVSYTNPVYMANLYRMKSDLREISARLATALGRMEEFGGKGMTAKKLRKYHFMFGMAYFTDPIKLGEFSSYEEALKAVDLGLAAGTAGVTKVYRVDIPGKDETVFGVALTGVTDADKYRDDKFIMGAIDLKDIKSTAHLPIEILISGNEVYALNIRFRIGSSFPDLSLFGKRSLMNINKAPGAIRKALKQTIGK